MLCFVLFLKVAVAFVWVLFLTSFLDSSCYPACIHGFPSLSIRESITLLIQQQLGKIDSALVLAMPAWLCETEGGLRAKEKAQEH